MELADQAVGFLLSFISISIFTYYTCWVIVLVSSSFFVQFGFFTPLGTHICLVCSLSVMVFQPFVDSDHFIQKFFLPQHYAIIIPVFAGVILLSFLSIFVGFVMLKSKQKAK